MAMAVKGSRRRQCKQPPVTEWLRATVASEVFTGVILVFASVRPSDQKLIEQTAGTPEMMDGTTCWKLSSDSKLLVSLSNPRGFSEGLRILKISITLNIVNFL